MAFRSGNTISGKEGRLFLDGEEMAYVKSFEANIEKEKTEVKVLGRRMTGHKTVGASGTGTLTVYKVTSKFVRLMINYVKTGEDPYFTFQEVLDDKSSGRGTERVTIYDVNFDSAKVAGLNAEGEILEEELPFTFEDIDMPEELREDF
ncbi:MULTISPECIES: phage tail tube protein [Pseudobacillus]|uniref:Phage portal protein n=1 Tax=Pseudobacillus wudalianchiensis TaxID=1743143 RepID=A0A1B9AMT8_9BACI|nr:phage tail tube protein [Bacillus wudalianchiensis]OCA85227.1 phage portal protein [Bacillus wudalianchiensis]